MSETENNTEKTTETKTVDTAPYMKKPGENKTESTDSNMIIPAALALVLAIVIGVTFYGDKNKTALTQVDATVVETENTETNEAQAQTAATVETVIEENNADTEISEAGEQNIVAETETAPTASEVVIVSEEKVIVATAPQTPSTKLMTATRPAPAPYRHYPYSQQRQQMPGRTKQHMEMLQQRRQAYEREMQNRRAQYETAMKAQQAKRARIAEAKKAVYQRARKEHLAAEQRIQQINKQIAKLREEIYQIMLESRKKGAPVHMHDM